MEQKDPSDSVEEKLREIALKVTYKEDAPFSGKTTLEDLDADSLDRVQILAALEEEFEIEIPDSEIQDITDMEGYINYIKHKISLKEEAHQGN